MVNFKAPPAEVLAEIKALKDKTSIGDWTAHFLLRPELHQNIAHINDAKQRGVAGVYAGCQVPVNDMVGIEEAKRNAEWIAASKPTVEFLLKMVEATRELAIQQMTFGCGFIGKPTEKVPEYVDAAVSQRMTDAAKGGEK